MLDSKVDPFDSLWPYPGYITVLQSLFVVNILSKMARVPPKGMRTMPWYSAKPMMDSVGSYTDHMKCGTLDSGWWSCVFLNPFMKDPAVLFKIVLGRSLSLENLSPRSRNAHRRCCLSRGGECSMLNDDQSLIVFWESPGNLSRKGTMHNHGHPFAIFA